MVKMHEQAKSEDDYVPTFLPGEMDDSGLVLVTCPEGHRSATVTQLPKYEVLFRSGTSALIDGYANEAVSSFAAALERLYEFFIRVVSRKLDISQDTFEMSWKHVAAQSERQFGAFCFLYALETGSAFSVPSKFPTFRNKVLHRGYIPPMSKVYEYAEWVFLTIRSVMVRLRETAGGNIDAEIKAHLERQRVVFQKHGDLPQSSMAQMALESPFYGEESVAFKNWLESYSGLMNALQSFYPEEEYEV